MSNDVEMKSMTSSEIKLFKRNQQKKKELEVYIASTVRKRYIRHIGTQYDCDNCNSKDDTSFLDQDGKSLGDEYYSEDINKLKVEIPQTCLFILGYNDITIVRTILLVVSIFIIWELTTGIFEYFNAVYKYQPDDDYTRTTFAIGLSFSLLRDTVFWGAVYVQLMESIRFQSQLITDQHHQNVIYMLNTMSPGCFHKLLNNDDDNEENINNNNDMDDIKDNNDNIQSPLQLSITTSSSQTQNNQNDDNNKIIKRTNKKQWDHNGAAKFLIGDCTYYLVMLISILPALLFIIRELVNLITNEFPSSNKYNSREYNRHGSIMRLFRIILWLFSQMLAARITMEWIWVLWCMHVSLSHEWEASSQTQWFRKRRIIDHMINIEDTLTDISNYWTVNSTIRLICAILQIGFFVAIAGAIIENQINSPNDTRGAGFVMGISFLFVCFLQVPLMFIFSMLPAAFAGYLADTHSEEISENFKKVINKFKGKLQVTELSTVVSAITGVSNGTFKSGIKFCGFDISMQRATVILTLITYAIAAYTSVTITTSSNTD